MNFDGVDQYLVRRVIESDSEIFSDLVKTAGLNPHTDFRFADLKDVDFTGSDLSEYDFTFADLRGAKWNGIAQEPRQYRFALQGRERSAAIAQDFDSWVQKVKRGDVWPERFFAFKFIVDNFGETYLVYDLLEEILTDEQSSTMRTCSTVYLSASYIHAREMLDYCVLVADRPRNLAFGARTSKLKRFAKELLSYLQLLAHTDRTPGRIPPSQLVRPLSRILT